MKRNWSALGILAAVLVVGCTSSLTNGEITHFTVDTDRALRGPWFGVDDQERAIPRDDGDAATRDDAFELAFDTAFLKFLPDLGGINEVIVVFSFRDGPGQKDEDEIVKILGPMRQQPDGSLLPSISRISYGPTTLESEYLSVSIRVVEYDREESEDTSAFIDFVASAAESLSIADPVTAAEIKVAKEIAKTIAASNDNDVVIEASFDLIPYDDGVWARNAGATSTMLPLRSGSFGLIKREVPTPFFNFFPFTQNLTFAGGKQLGCVPSGAIGDAFALPFALALDIVHLPIAAVARVAADVPDRASMDPLSRKNGAFMAGSEQLRFDHDTRHVVAGADRDLYRDKSWLTFSVSNGHQPLPREAVRYLTESERKIVERLGRRRISDVLDGSLVQDAIDDLVKAKAVAAEAAEAQTSGAFKLLTPRYVELTTAAQADLIVEIKRPAGVDIVPELVAKELAGGAALPTIAAAQTSTTSTVVEWTFTASMPAAHEPGLYAIVFPHDKAGKNPKLISLPLTLVAKLEAVKTAKASGVQSASPWLEDAKIALVDVKATSAGTFDEVKEVRIEYTSAGATKSLVVRRGDDGSTFGEKQISVTNSTGEKIETLSKITLIRDGGLPNVDA